MAQSDTRSSGNAHASYEMGDELRQASNNWLPGLATCIQVPTISFYKYSKLCPSNPVKEATIVISSTIVRGGRITTSTGMYRIPSTTFCNSSQSPVRFNTRPFALLMSRVFFYMDSPGERDFGCQKRKGSTLPFISPLKF